MKKNIILLPLLVLLTNCSTEKCQWLVEVSGKEPIEARLVKSFSNGFTHIKDCNNNSTVIETKLVLTIQKK